MIAIYGRITILSSFYGRKKESDDLFRFSWFIDAFRDT